MKHSDLFEFKELDSLDISSENSYLEVDHESKLLQVWTENSIVQQFPIPTYSSSSPGLSILWDKTTSKIRFGETKFTSPNHLPHEKKLATNLEPGDFECRIHMKAGGGMIVTDIRDFGKVTYHYNFDLVPISFGMDGNDLVISTTVYDSRYNLAAWYLEV